MPVNIWCGKIKRHLLRIKISIILSFPIDYAVKKSVYLALREATKKWNLLVYGIVFYFY